MTSLSNEQKQLLFDCCIGLASQAQTAEAKELIASNREAARLYSNLKDSFAPLESLASESCPDELVESTVLRLNNLARSSQLQLRQLLDAEQTRPVATKSLFWRNISRRLATAAVFMIVGTVLISAFKITSNIARHKSLQHQCQMQLSRIWQAINNYSSDHEGKLPAVATAAGAPWWKVGDQGSENQSNTRHLWLLVKGDYVDATDFVCPGSKLSRPLIFDPSQARTYNDFPGRNYVNYSFRIMCNKAAAESLVGQRVLMSDLSPLFENLPPNYSTSFKVQLDRKLLRRNSIDHNRCGQNILFCDGSVRFVKKRNIGISQDDIFTLQDTRVYQGVEVPSNEADAFLAP